jgi:hypothetical protein
MDSGLQSTGKMLLIFGAVFLAVGGLLLLAGRLPWLGRLPGDLVVQRKNFTFYFPLATSILLSILLSIVLWLIGRR